MTDQSAAPDPGRTRHRCGASTHRSGSIRPSRAIAILLPVLAACSSHDVTSPSGVFKSNPCLPNATVQLAVAATLRVDCSNGGTTVTFAGGGASYLVVPEFATDQAPFQLVKYTMASGTLSAAASASLAGGGGPLRGQIAPAVGLDGLLPSPRNLTAQHAADRLLRNRGRQLAMSGGLASLWSRPSQAGRFAVAQAPPAPGSVRSFQVLSGLGTTSTFATVAARLDFIGTNVLLYVDTLAPAGGFSASQLQSFGQYFDQVLYPIDTTGFGSPTDIDQNGHVIMLMTHVVNGDTPAATCNTQGYVAGFFNEEDFNGATDPHSNQGEIFYTLVPDPAGTYSCAHSVAELQGVVPATFLHELQHLISFGQHTVVSGGLPGASWLDEGLSIEAEEMGSLFYERKCPPPSCRTNPAQLFPDSSQGFIQNFLFDSYQFAYLPDTASITLESDANQGISWRGGAWLLVRWLGDQMGTGIYRTLEHGPSSGVAAIQQAAGQPFPQLFADFGLALYTDSLPGLARNTAPAANRFVTRNVKQLWNRLFVTSGPSAAVPLAEPVQLFAIKAADTTTALLYPGTVTYFRLDTPASSSTVTIRFAAPGGAAFAATLQPQLAVFRLPPGQ